MPDSTVIIGAGIIGCSTAYHLTESGDTDPSTVHLIEASSELFASASGKAAGFLASDWFGPATASLGALSFRLHKKLASQHQGREQWGYSRSTGTSLAQSENPTGQRGDDWLRDNGSRAQVAAVHDFEGPNSGPAWLTIRKGEVLDTISSNDSVGQVDPLRLSQFLLRESLHRGVQLHQPAQVTEVELDQNSVLTGVSVKNTITNEQRTIPCTRILIAAGAWSGKVFNSLFPKSSADVCLEQLAGHSIVVKSPRWTQEHEVDGCHAVFSTLRSGFSPEIFSRIGGEIYLAGLNDSTLPLPQIATDAKIDPASIDELKHVAERLLGQDGTDISDLEVIRSGLCFRPVTRTGNPIISRIQDKKLGSSITVPKGGGIFVAAGHGPWGISHSLGTGKVMAELIEEKTPSADVSRLALR